jgi:hypothetical protein
MSVFSLFSAAADVSVLTRRCYQDCQLPLISVFSAAADISIVSRRCD